MVSHKTLYTLFLVISQLPEHLEKQIWILSSSPVITLLNSDNLNWSHIFLDPISRGRENTSISSYFLEVEKIRVFSRIFSKIKVYTTYDISKSLARRSIVNGYLCLLTDTAFLLLIFL